MEKAGAKLNIIGNLKLNSLPKTSQNINTSNITEKINVESLSQVDLVSSISLSRTGKIINPLKIFPEEDSLPPAEKTRAEQLTSLFENSTVELQYGYSEILGDGRGITAGRAGFTTATGDLYEVVKIYTEKVPDNQLSKYLPRLKELAEKESSSVSGLGGLMKAWKKSSDDPLFRAVQDEVVDQLYYKPAMKYALDLGLESNLAKAFVYDTIIQHGEGPDPDGLPEIIKRTSQVMGGTPKSGIDEKKWLNEFIKMRRADLENAYDEKTREEWKKSVGRCDVFTEIAGSNNYDLSGPIKIADQNYNVTIP